MLLRVDKICSASLSDELQTVNAYQKAQHPFFPVTLIFVQLKLNLKDIDCWLLIILQQQTGEKDSAIEENGN